MKYIKPMNCKDFADYLLTLKTGDTIEFGIDPGYSWPDVVPDSEDVNGWYFAKVMEIEAANMDEAMDIATDLYYNGEFAPDIPDEVNCKLMYANDGEYDTEWVEF